jgi:uncharacterized protein
MALAPRLPLSIDDLYGAYGLIENYKDLIAQNLKMIVLTSPGERIMDPTFGVGLRSFLFESFTASTSSTIKSSVFRQAGKYMPFVTIKNVNVNFDEATNSLYVAINYIVNSLSLEDTLVVKETIEG